MNKIKEWIKQDTILCVALLLGICSTIGIVVMQIAGGSFQLLSYGASFIESIDFRLLGILFALMGVMGGFQRIGVLSAIGRKLVMISKSNLGLELTLVLLCFFSSMVMTNDVALIAFVPFAVLVLKLAKREESLMQVVIFQTIAANLGSMLTPLGNPQNLYLYNLAEMSFGEFILLMLPYSACALVLIWLCLLGLQRKGTKTLEVDWDQMEETQIQKVPLVAYVVLFILCLFTVLRILSYEISTLAVFLYLLIWDREILKKIDYSLLLTFIGFFVFIGNIKNLDMIQAWLEQMVGGRELLTGILASQVISNVPAALLLAGFTEDVRTLIVGVNVGGLGTLIASMASLISFKLYGAECPDKKGKYLGQFTLWNLIFLAAMLVVYWVCGSEWLCLII